MEWFIFLPIFILVLLAVLFLRIPVAWGLFGVSIVTALIIWQNYEAVSKLVGLSIISSINSFTFSAIPLFILMGEILFRSRIAQDALSEISLLLRNVPGRLPMVTVAGGTAFGLLSGSSLANTALFTRTLLPQMRSSGYDTKLAAGSILASSGLAMVLPPSALGILWGGIAQVPIGPLLMAGIIPGFLMALGYISIILFRARKNETTDAQGQPRPFNEVLAGVLKNLVVPGFIALMILGIIFFGFGTPTESAAIGVIVSLIVAMGLRRLSFRDLVDSCISSAKMTGSIFVLVMASTLYGQIMAYMEATQGLVAWVSSSITNGAIMLFLIILILVILSAFIDQASIMLITAPLLIPIANDFGWNLIWFSILVLVTLQIGNISPPFGMSLFVMKGIAPDLSMATIYRSVTPWIVSDLVVVTILALFPALVLAVPALMG